MDALIINNPEYFLPNYTNYIAIIANGLFPTKPEIINFLKKAKLIIACDGAIHNLARIGILADYAIGDGDSAEIIARAFSKNPYIHIPDQNSNDLTKAFNFAIENLPDQPIIIFAASGLREDHAIANFGLLAEFATRNNKTAMLSDYGIFNVCRKGSTILTAITGQQISFFCLNQTTLVSCPELKWSLEDFSFKNIYSGTLNQATQNQLTIDSSGSLIVYRAFEIKE